MGLLLPGAVPGQIAPRASSGLVRFWFLVAGGSWAAGLLFAVVWAVLIQPASEANRTVDLVIPKGAAAAVAAGTRPPFIPDKLTLGPNGKLRVRNEDVVSHVVAGTAIPPGASGLVTASRDQTSLVCSIHPSGYLGVGLEGAPGPIEVVLMSLVIGVPIALLVGVVTTIAQRLDM